MTSISKCRHLQARDVQIKKHNDKFVTKSYLTIMVFESIKSIELQKKRKKIPSDDFEIPEIKRF